MRNPLLSLVLGTLLALGLAGNLRVHAWESTVECSILYEISDGFFVGAGTESRLKKGAAGVLLRGGQTVARIEVVNVSKDSSFLRIVGARPENFPGSGEQVTLAFGDETESPTAPTTEPSKTLRNRQGGQDPEAATLSPGQVNAPAIPQGSRPGQLPAEGKGDFVPLLAGDRGKVGAFTDAYNISQGQVSIRQLFQVSPGNDYNYFGTHLRSSGSLERIEATPWAFEWSADLSYRDGKAYKDVDDFQEPRFELYRLAFYRKFEDQSWVRVGRFLSRELPAIGYLDGAQGEWVASPRVRVGGMFGFKPVRRGLEPSGREPGVAAYLTYRSEEARLASYYGTFGVLTSMYDGSLDRTALLAEQTVRYEKLTVLSSTTVDFDVGGARVHNGPRITRFDLVASYAVWDHTTLRAGIDRFERPDTAAERDQVPALALRDLEFFHRAYTRAYVGASHTLGWGFRLGEEASVTDSDIDPWSFRWNVSLTKVGLPLLPDASSATLTVYNYSGEDLDGYGGRLSAYVPFPGNRFSLQPELAFRFLQSDIHRQIDFSVSDLGCRAHYVLSKTWSFSGGASYIYTEDAQRLFIDLSATYKW